MPRRRTAAAAASSSLCPGPGGDADEVISALDNHRLLCPLIFARVGRHPGSPTGVRRLLARGRVRPAPRRSGPSWREFLQQQAASIAASDFFTVESISLRRYYALFFIEQSPAAFSLPVARPTLLGAGSRSRPATSASSWPSGRVEAGRRFRVVDVDGGQVADTWAFVANDPSEHHSAQHTRAYVDRLFPRPGEQFFTNRRRPILTLEEDNTPGAHDMLIAACDPPRYEGLGVEGWHASCEENLLLVTAAVGIASALALTRTLAPTRQL
jgi:hypothetical protein